MMQPVRVLHLIWALDMGGAERQVVEIVRHLDRQRYEPVVGCLTRKGRWGEELEREGIRVVSFDKRPGLDPFLLPRLVGFLRRNRFSVVHTHAFTAATWGRLATAVARVPVVVAHEHSSFALASAVRRTLDRMLIPATDRWLVVSDRLRRDLVTREKLPEHRVQLIRNGIRVPDSEQEKEIREQARDVRRRLVPPSWKRVLGTVGRLESRKGLDVFLEAVSEISRRMPHVGALLVGEGPLRNELELRVRELGLEGRVIFAGRREDIHAVLRALDVFVLPSYTEGLSISLLEAASAGLPIVATAVGGNVEVIEDGRNGLLVPPGDPIALARGLERMLDHSGEALEMGRRATVTVRSDYSLEEMVRSVEDAYVKLLENSRKLETRCISIDYEHS